MLKRKLHKRPNGTVALLIIKRPPVNSVSAALRMRLVEALEWAFTSAESKAVVITGYKGFFSAGAEIREFNTRVSRQYPHLRDVIKLIQTAPKPVVAAINGWAIGGGLELALGCHSRVALFSARLGLPEVRLGLIPGAGGMQRLIRIIGIKKTLEIVLKADTFDALQAHHYGVIDHLIGSDAKLSDKACDYALELANGAIQNEQAQGPIKGESVSSVLFEEAKKRADLLYPGCPAPIAAINCIKSSLQLSLDESLEKERKVFNSLVEGPESAAQRYLFFSERAIVKDFDIGRIDYIDLLGQLESFNKKAEINYIKQIERIWLFTISKVVYALVADGTDLERIKRRWHNFGMRIPLDTWLKEINKNSISPKEIKTFNHKEIIFSILSELVNEARKKLKSGVLKRATDFDLISVIICGFPIIKGGPIYYYDSMIRSGY